MASGFLENVDPRVTCRNVGVHLPNKKAFPFIAVFIRCHHPDIALSFLAGGNHLDVEIGTFSVVVFVFSELFRLVPVCS